MQELTIKQRKFIKAYLMTGNATQAAKNAGYRCKNDASYAEMGHQNLRKLEGVMSQVLVEAGLDNATLAKKALEGLNAMVVKPFSHKGKVIDEKVYIDYPTRAKYLEITAKMKGLLKEKVEKQVSGAVTICIKGKK
jgi:phage terminase small subunit